MIITDADNFTLSIRLQFGRAASVGAYPVPWPFVAICVIIQDNEVSSLLRLRHLIAFTWWSSFTGYSFCISIPRRYLNTTQMARKAGLGLSRAGHLILVQ